MKAQYLPVQHLPKSERPYEKCLESGAGCLSDAELLAVILRTGTAKVSVVDLTKQLLKLLPGENLAGLFQISYEELLELDGIGKVKAVQLLCLAEIVRRVLRCQIPRDTLTCDEPQKIAVHYMSFMRFLDTEQVRVLVLDGKNALTKDILLSTGSFTSSFASPREIFHFALKHKAVSIILLHNHPSGDPTPSKEDILLTRRVSDAGNLLGIPLLDHIILGDDRYLSFKESGYLS